MGRYSEREKRNEMMEDENVNEQSIDLKKAVGESGRVNRDTNNYVEDIDILDNCPSPEVIKNSTGPKVQHEFVQQSF